MMDIKNANSVSMTAQQLHEIACITAASNTMPAGTIFHDWSGREAPEPNVVWVLGAGMASLYFTYSLDDGILSYCQHVWVDADGRTHQVDVENCPPAQAMIAAAVQLGVVVNFDQVYFEGPGFEDEAEAASAPSAVH